MVGMVKNILEDFLKCIHSFIDLEKCFDRIDRNMLFYKMLMHDIGGRFFDAISSLYGEIFSEYYPYF
jgi:hypothetical protein